MQAIAEAVVLGESAGLDRTVIAQGLIADCGGRAGSSREVGENRAQRLQPPVSPAADEQRFPADSEDSGKRERAHAGDGSRVSRQCRRVAAGDEQDFSAVLRRMEEVGGVAVTHSAR